VVHDGVLQQKVAVTTPFFTSCTWACNCASVYSLESGTDAYTSALSGPKKALLIFTNWVVVPLSSKAYTTVFSSYGAVTSRSVLQEVERRVATAVSRSKGRMDMVP
jgi:hypothetical protein